MAKVSLMVLAIICLPSQGQSAPCIDLKPFNQPMPEYPSFEQARSGGYFLGTSYMHNLIQGEVTVQYEVKKSGKVAEAVILNARNVPTRNIPGQSFDGFLETNAIPTVLKWLYDPNSVPAACIAEVTFLYKSSSNRDMWFEVEMAHSYDKSTVTTQPAPSPPHPVP